MHNGECLTSDETRSVFPASGDKSRTGSGHVRVFYSVQRSARTGQDRTGVRIGVRIA